MVFRKVLVANRGEIARRVIRTLNRMGVASVAVYSDADANSPHALEASERAPLGDPAPAKSYMNIEALLAAAKATGAEAIHPGYGFLSEHEEFARACRDAGLVFLGPSPEAIEAMGHKERARRIAVEAGVPVVPGTGVIPSESALLTEAEKIGYPVMVKAAAGGGGIGMHRAANAEELTRAFADAVKKAETFFGDRDVYLERLVLEPHHIEVQVFGDGRGEAIALGERECTIQRRHQKVLEESPSPFVDEATREKLCAAAAALARKVNYAGAGTVEFIMDENRRFYFLEMNTRLQVEHPITEERFGIDLVEWQLRMAAGEMALPSQESLEPRGHAIECRINSENPDKKFFPSMGVLTHIHWPHGKGVRVDAGVEEGFEVSRYYDSLLAKVIVHANDRPQAIERMKAALRHMVIEGVVTNRDMHLKILEHPVFLNGNYHTGFLKTDLGYFI
ncbi:MAG: Acetyl-/propionyl-coenzyme A carboxylase alpha chain [Myxococcota bacterium]|nr:Acetyl-/propionyl-coenzyme A carboxylase alpha chain [Myxococcota bacterium]